MGDIKYWAEQIWTAIRSDDFEALSDAHNSMVEELSKAKRFDDIITIATMVLKNGVDALAYERIKLDNIVTFESDFTKLWGKGIRAALDNPEVKAIYFEYFYDGGDASDGNLFLCESFDVDDDGWASDFGRDGVILGMSILPCMDYDPDFDLDDEVRTIGDYYVDTLLYATCLKVICHSGETAYPFGFAMHDNPVMTYIP